MSALCGWHVAPHCMPATPSARRSEHSALVEKRRTLTAFCFPLCVRRSTVGIQAYVIPYDTDEQKETIYDIIKKHNSAPFFNEFIRYGNEYNYSEYRPERASFCAWRPARGCRELRDEREVGRGSKRREVRDESAESACIVRALRARRGMRWPPWCRS